jgi:hypothetical protein
MINKGEGENGEKRISINQSSESRELFEEV